MSPCGGLSRSSPTSYTCFARATWAWAHRRSQKYTSYSLVQKDATKNIGILVFPFIQFIQPLHGSGRTTRKALLKRQLIWGIMVQELSGA